MCKSFHSASGPPQCLIKALQNIYSLNYISSILDWMVWKFVQHFQTSYCRILTKRIYIKVEFHTNNSSISKRFSNFFLPLAYQTFRYYSLRLWAFFRCNKADSPLHTFTTFSTWLGPNDASSECNHALLLKIFPRSWTFHRKCLSVWSSVESSGGIFQMEILQTAQLLIEMLVLFWKGRKFETFIIMKRKMEQLSWAWIRIKRNFIGY